MKCCKMKQPQWGSTLGAIALSYPPPFPIVIDDSSWKNAAESFTVALTLTLGGYESAIAPYFVILATLKGILYSILL